MTKATTDNKGNWTCSSCKKVYKHEDLAQECCDFMDVNIESLPELPDSGKRQSFGASWGVRESGDDKPALEGISPYALMRLGMLLTKANKKYGDFRNWEKGLPISTFVGGILRHCMKYTMRDTSEDHLAAIMWNAMAIIHYQEVGAHGKSFEELDNMPKWR